MLFNGDEEMLMHAACHEWGYGRGQNKPADLARTNANNTPMLNALMSSALLSFSLQRLKPRFHVLYLSLLYVYDLFICGLHRFLGGLTKPCKSTQ